jgi:hypothetical protein
MLEALDADTELILWLSWFLQLGNIGGADAAHRADAETKAQAPVGP